MTLFESEDEHNQFLRRSRQKKEAAVISLPENTGAVISHHHDQVEPIQSDNLHHFPPAIKSDGDDMEAMEHPALAYGVTLPNALPTTLVVPKFWNPARFGGDIRQYLGNGDTLPSKEEALSIGSFSEDGRETIFVSIASYRDPDCVSTLESIYYRAAYPERIRTVVVEQRREGDSFCTKPVIPCEETPEQVLCQYRHLIQSYEFDAQLAVGPTFARHISYRHYRGEYFAMQVDSHVRFVQDWDADIIKQWKSSDNEMAVLSTYLLDLNGAIDAETHQSKKTTRALMCNAYFEGGVIKNGQQMARPVGTPGTPTMHPFWAAGFSFARGHFVVQVPYDQYSPMVFQGEEISMAVRAFTYGYDIYAPERSVCFHMYALHKNRENRLAVPKFSENRKLFSGVDMEALKRLTSIIELNPEKDISFVDIEQSKYGIGRIRSPTKFYHTFGIHVDTQTAENHLCWFAGKNMQDTLLPHMRDDRMGIDYTKLDFQFKDPSPDQP